MSLVKREDSLSLDQKQRIDDICLTFEDQWLTGERPVLEPFLGQVEAAAQSALLEELLLVELEYRCGLAEKTQLQSYLERFPEDPSVVRRAFETVRQREIPLRLLPGTAIGRYRIKRIVGTGGFGTVYQAWDQQLKRDVALKVPHRSHVSEADARQRLLDEARAVARLQHPGIVAIHDIQQLDDGTVYLVMQYVQGESLAELCQSRRLSLQQATNIMIDVGQAIASAHLQGIVHRDVKPSNILIDENGCAHVADFGLALEETEQHLRAGEYAGTLGYMAPEQLRGEADQLDGRADIWALGVILYQLLADRLPFQSGSRQQLIQQVLQRDPKPLRQIDAKIPKPLERACLRCLGKRPADRYGTASDLVEDLRHWQTARPSRRIWTAKAIVASLLLAVLAGNWFARPEHPTRSSPLNGARLQGSIDLLVWSAVDPKRQGIAVTRTSDQPLRPGDHVRLQLQLNRAAYIYIVWLNTRGVAQPVYPWRLDDWTNRPMRERRDSLLTLPQAQDRAWAIGNDPAGMETLLMLARSSPLPKNVDLRQLLDQRDWQRLALEKRTWWLQDGSRQTPAEKHDRGVQLDKVDAINDPFLRLQRRLVEPLRPHFELIRAVSFPVEENS